jgi:hypothetical protein
LIALNPTRRQKPKPQQMSIEEIREAPARFIQSRQTIWIESSLGKADYRYIGCDPLEERVAYRSFPRDCDLWKVVRADGSGKIRQGILRSGDHLILKSAAVHEYLSFRGIEFCHLHSDAGMGELWPVLSQVERWSSESGSYIGFFDHNERRRPIQSGATIYFLPVYRGCIWLADHFRETQTVLRVFNADLCRTGVKVRNCMTRTIKVVTESPEKVIQSHFNVAPGESFALYPFQLQEPIYLKHYTHSPQTNPLLSSLTFLYTACPGFVPIKLSGELNLSRHSASSG